MKWSTAHQIPILCADTAGMLLPLDDVALVRIDKLSLSLSKLAGLLLICLSIAPQRTFRKSLSKCTVVNRN